MGKIKFACAFYFGKDAKNINKDNWNKLLDKYIRPSYQPKEAYAEFYVNLTEKLSDKVSKTVIYDIYQNAAIADLFDECEFIEAHEDAVDKKWASLVFEFDYESYCQKQYPEIDIDEER